MANLFIVEGQNGHKPIIGVAFIGTGINIPHGHREIMLAAQAFERNEHVITQMAERPAVEDEMWLIYLGRPESSQRSGYHRGESAG